MLRRIIIYIYTDTCVRMDSNMKQDIQCTGKKLLYIYIEKTYNVYPSLLQIQYTRKKKYLEKRFQASTISINIDIDLKNMTVLPICCAGFQRRILLGDKTKHKFHLTQSQLYHLMRGGSRIIRIALHRHDERIRIDLSEVNTLGRITISISINDIDPYVTHCPSFIILGSLGSYIYIYIMFRPYHRVTTYSLKPSATS
jgi:hypothetical protein